MTTFNTKEEIDAIMAEMEAQTPKHSEANKSFDEMNGETSETASKVDDDVDAKGIFSGLFTKGPVKPGKLRPSRPTEERYYDTSHKSTGIALIFNQVKFKGEPERKGSTKDARDLNEVLTGIGFEVTVFTDLSVSEIKKQLRTGKLSASLVLFFFFNATYFSIGA